MRNFRAQIKASLAEARLQRARLLIQLQLQVSLALFSTNHLCCQKNWHLGLPDLKTGCLLVGSLNFGLPQ